MRGGGYGGGGELSAGSDPISRSVSGVLECVIDVKGRPQCFDWGACVGTSPQSRCCVVLLGIVASASLKGFGFSSRSECSDAPLSVILVYLLECLYGA